MPSKRRQIAGLGLFLVIVFLIASLGGLFTARSVATWYPTLKRPDWTPPDAVFGPAWTALYLTMAVAAWLVWRRGGGRARPALIAFGAQLLLNVAWSGLFFAMRWPAAGMVDIVLLWLAIVVMVVCFLRVSVLAGLILLPYLAWVSFAAVLNFAIWRMN